MQKRVGTLCVTAAVMLCIRDLYGLDCSLSRLQELAVTLGADIPYCLAGGTKLCEGIGEILTALPEEIYPIAAARFLTPVYHPMCRGEEVVTIRPLLREVRAAAFGSGAVHLANKKEVLALLLSDSQVPLVLDAESLRILADEDTLAVRTGAPDVILTPHIGEFRALTGLSAEELRRDPSRICADYAEKNRAIVVLKGPRTIVASPDGRIYFNASGNEALAQAGSGDVLTGMIAAMLTLENDPFAAACRAVFMHGHIADEGRKTYSCRNFPLEKFPEIMDRMFLEHGL